MTTRPDRATRLAAQLRANLARRKQARADDAPAAAAIAVADQRTSASDPNDVAAPAA